MATSFTRRTEIRPGIWLDPRRAVWFEELRLLAVADLHWGYADSHRAHGNLLPAWGDRELAATLRELCADYAPSAMLWLGDSLHALAGRASAEEFLRAPPVPVTLIAGNHDVRWTLPSQFFLHLENFFFHHGDRAAVLPPNTIEIIGHHHPAFVLRDRAGAYVKLPALVASSRRLILPAFSPWAAGVEWNARTLPDEILWAIAPHRVFPVDPNRRPPHTAPFLPRA